MNPFDLLETAHVLLSSAEGNPTEAGLRRAISSAYYALFHCLSRECADLLIGGSGSDRSDSAWRQVYRALEHGAAKTKCRKREMIRKFPEEIQSFAKTFADLQEKRHSADYDPSAHRAVQRCWVGRIESASPHLRCEVRRLIARGIPEPANV